MLKILTIGDPHFKINNVPESDEFTEKLYEKVAEIQPDIVVCLGDVLDRHETMHMIPHMRATTCMKRLSEMTKLYLLIGNHDRPNNSTFTRCND